MKKYTRIYAEVDLDAVKHNMESMKANISENTGIIGVVKTDGYGHGSVPVAMAIDSYVEGYAVATVEEAVTLRSHGISKPIMILGPVHESCFEDLICNKIQPAIFQLDQAEKLSALSVRHKTVTGIHLAVDTGMGRIGYSPDEAAADEVDFMSKLPGIRIEGLFTHFSKADETDKSYAESQLDLFLHFAELLEKRDVQVPAKHCSNSAGIIDMKRANMDMVRAGISVYGLYPSDEVDHTRVDLKPALSLRSFITYIKTVPAGTRISYGGTFTAEHEMCIATVSAGYGDGYPRSLSNKGSVLIRGQRAAILGRICMDQFMVDVTHIKDAEAGDRVTLIGADAQERISVEEIALTGGGFHYEIICDIGKRVPRIYIEDGKVIGSKDCFDERYYDFCRLF